MHTVMKWAVAPLVLAVFVLTARPQEPAGPEGSTVKLLLLRQKSVQKELELTPEVTKKVMDFTQAQSEAARKAKDLPEAARKEAFDKLAKQNEKFLADDLTAKQTTRLDQITKQFTPLTELTKPETSKELKLSDDQVKRFKDLQVESRTAFLGLVKSKEAGKTEKLAKLRNDTSTKILSVLTDEQRTKVRELAGPPFEGEIVFEEPDQSKDK